MANIVTLGRGQQAVTGLPIGKLNDLDRRIAALESSSSGGSGGAILIEVPTGDMGQNIFTVTNRPKMVDVDGTLYYEGLQYTYSSGTITIDDANYSVPSEYIRSLYNAADTKCVSVGYESPTASDIVSFILIPANITITEVSGSTDDGTFTVGLQYRPRNAKNATGTNILTTAIVLDSDGATTTTFTSASVPADYYLTLVAAGSTGTVGDFILNVKYTID